MKCALILVAMGLTSPLLSQYSRSNPPLPDLTIPLKVHEADKPIGFSLVITPGGFTRREGSILAQGLYEIRIINRTGNKGLEIHLDRISDTTTPGEASAETGKLRPSNAADISQGKLRLVETLQPGTYQLRVAGYPRWTYILTVK